MKYECARLTRAEAPVRFRGDDRSLCGWLASMMAAIAVAGCEPAVEAPTTQLAPINAVVGDASWVEQFGRAPTEDDARNRDDQRHAVHLAWIERELRSRPVGHLSADERDNRAMLLDTLTDYRRKGERPLNPLSYRSPRFIDDAGRICAVGYLIERSDGRALAEAINRDWEYALLMDIEDERLAAWVESSGFTAVELASIQPAYVGFAIPGELVIGIAAGGLALVTDVAFLIAASYYGAEGLPRAGAITELILGVAHVGSAVGLGLGVRKHGTFTIATTSGLAAVGAAQIGHAVWSLARAPDSQREFSIGAAPTDSGAILSLAFDW